MRWLVILAVVACGKSADSGPTCEQVVDHMLEVTKQELTGHGDMALGDRPAMLRQCEERKMPADKRKCLVEAKTMREIALCRAGTTTDPSEKQRRPLPPRVPASP